MRILQVADYGYWVGWTPMDLDDPDGKMMGGGETAVIRTSQELAKLGHEVIVFYTGAAMGKHKGVDYMPRNLYLDMATTMASDVIIGWENPWEFQTFLNTKLKILSYQNNHMKRLGVLDSMFDKYFAVSQWHAQQLYDTAPMASPDKFFISSNGVYLDSYKNRGIKRNPNKIIYCSSPDRGLHHLLRMWPEIKSRLPQAELHVYYEIKKLFHTPPAWLAYDRIMEVKDHYEAGMEGVCFRGAVGRYKMEEEQLSAALMVYPCDPVAPTEGFSISCLEALAAGVPLITSEVDALPELWREAAGILPRPNPANYSRWISAVVAAQSDKVLRQDMVKGGRALAKRHDWSSVVANWEASFEQWIEEKKDVQSK